MFIGTVCLGGNVRKEEVAKYLANLTPNWALLGVFFGNVWASSVTTSEGTGGSQESAGGQCSVVHKIHPATEIRHGLHAPFRLLVPDRLFILNMKWYWLRMSQRCNGLHRKH